MWNAILAFSIMLFGFALGGALMLLGARIAKVEKRSFKKAILASFACSFANILIATGFSKSTGAGFLVGIFINIWLQVYLVKMIFSTKTGKAVLTLIFNFIATIIIIIIYLSIFSSYLYPLFTGKIKM